MKEKVLLASNPTELASGRFPKRNFPLGLAQIAAELRATGRYDVKCFDYQTSHVTDAALLSELRDNRYLAVGIKGYAVDYLWVLDLVNLIRAHIGKDVVIVIGGPLATFSYDVVLKTADVDFCILGEADTAMGDLLDNLDDPDKVAGVAYLEADGKVKRVPGGMLPGKEIDDIELPAYDLFDIEQYTVNREPFPRSERIYMKKYRALDFVTGRGCPFTCAFCGRLTRKYRKRSVDLVVDEMKFVIRTYGINLFAIEDELFLQKEDWVAEFCEKMMPLGVHWRCQSRAKGLKPDILKLMKRAGCQRITLGVESGSAEILEKMHKQITPDDIAYSVEALRDAGIYPGVELIIGSPGENERTVKETVDLFKKLHLPHREMAYLQLLPGSPWFSQFLGKAPFESHEQILIDLSEDDGTLKTFIHNVSGLPDDELFRLKTEAEQAMADNYDEYMRKNRKVRYYVQDLVIFINNRMRHVETSDSPMVLDAPPTAILEGQDHR